VKKAFSSHASRPSKPLSDHSLPYRSEADGTPFWLMDRDNRVITTGAFCYLRTYFALVGDQRGFGAPSLKASAGSWQTPAKEFSRTNPVQEFRELTQAVGKAGLTH
jgi:hypothetical protein